MRSFGMVWELLVFIAFAAPLGVVAMGCRPTAHPVVPGSHGVPRSSDELEALIEQPGPVQVETVAAADWQVERAGVINLEHPTARAQKLEPGFEPIRIYFHALRHPDHGLYLVDTGVERAQRDAPDQALLRGIVADVVHLDRMKIHVDTAGWLQKQGQPVSGVFFTHLHVDHLTGLRDVPRGTPLFAGPGETMERKAENLFMRPLVDAAFHGHAPLREWSFERDPSGRFAGVTDIFGDRSVWALHVPGHSAGSTAYLARTPRGPMLLVGDACHTAWGWRNDVEPGNFSHDKPASRRSLKQLRELVARHPSIDVRLGHQPLSQ